MTRAGSAPCPVCPAPAARVEMHAHGWRFCHACASVWLVDELGEMLTILRGKQGG